MSTRSHEDAQIIDALREAISADSGLLTSDLMLPNHGLPAISVAMKLRHRTQEWSARPRHGTESAMLRGALQTKLAARNFVLAQGIRTPELFWSGTAQQPPRLSELPEQFVLKPNKGHSTKGTVVYDKGQNLLTGSALTAAQIQEWMLGQNAQLNLSAEATWLIEEKIADFDPEFPVPRDFKFTAAGGRCFFVYVANRNVARKEWSASWYTRDWRRINDRMNYDMAFGPDFSKPAGYESLLQTADSLAYKFGIFLRIDLYLTAHGPVFGEFTPFPNHGRKNTEIGELAFSQLWSLYPDRDI